LEDILASASKLLCTGGRFAMVHRPDRMMDILMGMRQYRLEPKRIRMVHPQAHKPPDTGFRWKEFFMESLI
jgi:tRNA1Val (adenine37-N6)-methyltransferase